MLKAIFILNPDSFEKIYGPQQLAQIKQLVEILWPLQTAESVIADPSVIAEAEIVFSGWGAPRLDAALLAAAPRLQAVFYGAGSIRNIVTDAFWERDIIICSAWVANAMPVAEYTLAAVLFSLKRGWYYARVMRESKALPARVTVPGGFGSVVGIISLGVIGRRVCELLRSFDLRVIAYDPCVDPAVAVELGIELVSLDEVFRQADVISLHTPWLAETEGMITGRHFAAMKSQATFINTARGAVVRENEMIEVLRCRPDLQAVLDVTYPEPPAVDSPLYELPNVVLTPHIAGSMDRECQRMGQYMVDELRRFLAAAPLQWRVTQEQAFRMA